MIRTLTRVLMLSLFIFPVLANALNAPECFRFDLLDTPDSIKAPPAAPVHAESWCYASPAFEGKKYSFVFRVEANELTENNAALVELTNGKATEVTHGVLNHGRISTHRSRMVDINPLPVPLLIQEARTQGKPVRRPLSPSLERDADRIFQSFATSRLVATRGDLEEGTFEAYVDEAGQPYDGFWWNYSDSSLSTGPFSPLGKYDAIVKGWTGTDPRSAQWEEAHHNATVAWGGHCNGWAASSLLYPDDTKMRWDSANKKVILASDIKGMLAEASFCVNNAFYGKRYYSSTDDLNDIYPDKFHKVLLYYIRDQNKSVALDTHPDDWVDNSVISGYKMTIEKAEARENTFHVSVAAKQHNYNPNRAETGGAAAFRTIRYSYDLVTDGNGNILRGTWISANPDFLWVPTAQANCGRENPNIDPAQIDKIVNTFPEATKNTSPINFKLSRQLDPSEEVTIKVPTTGGAIYTIHVVNNKNESLLLSARFDSALYPTRYIPGWWGPNQLVPPGESDISFSGDNLTFLSISNDSSDEATTGGDFQVTKMTYWGGP
jgi:hypothetical protein